MSNTDPVTASRRAAVPRGLSTTGPVLFSYGFRPFFLGAAVWACCTMVLWIMALTGRIDLAGDYGAPAWHAHEMLFGFASAVLAGFLLTAVPNWTGRLPVSGRPLVFLFSLWAMGRIAMLVPDLLGSAVSAAADAVFLPTLLFICVREVIAGKKWADLKVIAGLGVLSLANICFHVETIVKGAPEISPRFAVAAYIGMVIVVGGRILPSFTRNWLAKRGSVGFPAPYGGFDTATILVSVAALLGWALHPEGSVIALMAGFAAVLQAIRLYRWRGWATVAEPLVAILHVAYLFVPLGFLAMTLSALGLMEGPAAMHVLTIGTVTTMMLAVMTRATRGHTGRVLHASAMTSLSYLAILVCALVRPLTAVFPDGASTLYAIAGSAWLMAFILYLWEYTPMLVKKRRQMITQ
ncbi:MULTISPECIES: NnrS family protein [unclassified Rhizobium]|uniref:NnrS family protein n=1 Tax=unclassified Rhizobium TaxID=2613769 RepID=UPI0006FEE1FD|nr:MULTISPECIES: NnrS family protein [unclassified Rhizobium]KQV39962.1 short-chain dehydrogenase [Rhizobium sp. Root1212]KRD31672.1 short-chain dehydrogenase [Rhizobium sp. Root268]